MPLLPKPGAEEVARSNALINSIREIIASAGGRLPFSRFMELALYDSKFGYYRQRRPVISSQGDFITAPEVSPLFSRCIAQYWLEVYENGGRCVLELGAGSGAFARDFLLALRGTLQMPEHYYILEVSAARREEQQETLKKTLGQDFSRVVWLDTLPSTPIEGMIFANEVLDALPCTRFRVTERGVEEGYVTADHAERFEWRWDEASSEGLVAAVERLRVDFPVGYVSEMHLQFTAWMRSLAEVLGNGVILLIDYGYERAEYYHPQRDQGTLRCHYRHHVHDDPLVYVGIQDIAAHVDFTAVMEAGINAGLSVMGYGTQADFLMQNGLAEMVRGVRDPQSQLVLSQEVKYLTLPSEMGALFKVVSFSS